jgi:integrase
MKSYPKNEHYRRISLDATLAARLERYITDQRLVAEKLLFSFPADCLVDRVPEAVPVGGVTAPNPAGRRYRHGTLTGYSMGRCRCASCRAAYARYRAARRQAGLDRPVVGRPVGTDGHLPRSWFRQRIWAPAVAAAGITRQVRIHDLRHTHASWLLAGGADLQTVRERLGHDNLRATEKYLHTVPSVTDVGLEALARVRAQARSGV